MIFNLNKQAGFSLVETLVAISILLLVIVGPMTITSRTAKSATFASEQVQAFFLAQEGVELAQKARSDLVLRKFLPTVHANYLATPWSNFIDTSSGFYEDCYNTSGCGLEWNTAGDAIATPQDCSSSGACLLRKAVRSDYDDRSMFNHRSTAALNPATIFTRKIYFTENGTSDVQVVSEVTWRTGSLVANQKVTVDTYLYNVYEN